MRHRFIAVIGSRDWPDIKLVRQYVLGLPEDVILVSGRGGAVDNAAEQTAAGRQMPTLIFPARWPEGRQAGFVRNAYIARHADEVRAFWDGLSCGTLDTMTKAHGCGKPVFVMWNGEWKEWVPNA